MVRTMLAAFIIFFFLCGNFSSYAQVYSMNTDYKSQFKKIEDERKKAERDYLELLRQSDPSLYEQKKREMQVEERIESILRAYRSGNLSYENAKNQLFTPVKESMSSRLDNIPAEIATLKARLEILENAKRDPTELVNRQVDRLLGKGSDINDLLP